MSGEQLQPIATFEIEALRSQLVLLRGLLALYGGRWSISTVAGIHAAVTGLAGALEILDRLGPSAGVYEDRVHVLAEPFADALDGIRRTLSDPAHPIAMAYAQVATDVRAGARQFAAGQQGGGNAP